MDYRDVVSSEDCEEINRFYKSYLAKYESMYRILYHLLQPNSFSTREPTSGISPSLAALDDAQALRWREWIRGEPGEDVPLQHSTISGHLTPTSPRHEDMQLDLSLNVMPEGSLGDLPTAVNEEARRREHQVPEERLQETPFETSIEGTPDTHLKVKPESNIKEVPRKIQRTREVSREDATALTGQFFATVNGRNRGNVTEGPVAITSEDCNRNENDVPTTSTPVVDNTSVAPEAETTETRSPRTFLLTGSPSRPTATATCRLRTWVQHVSEGQINEPTQDDAHSIESGGTETSVLAKGIPEELGLKECRVLHPFEIPGVRYPTDATPPNQRRLAENDALVELIQTTEYLEDAPTWGQRDYWLYPPTERLLALPPSVW